MTTYNLRKLSEEVGVAPSTISRILNGKARKYRISSATEARVRQAAEKLGFRPNYFAHSLNTGRTNTIGLVFANKIGAFLGNIMEGVEARLRATDYQMAVATCENDPDIEKVELGRLLHRQTDGVILYPSAVPFGQDYPSDHLKPFEGMQRSYVVIGRRIDYPADHILFDDHAAGREAARFFLDAGCTRFGMVTLSVNCSANRDRQHGYVATLRDAGVPEADIIVVGDHPDHPPAAARLGDVDAVWGVNSAALLDCIRDLRTVRDIRSMRFASLGDIPHGDLLDTNIRARPMPSYEMGTRAAERLLWRMDHPDAPPETIRLPWPDE